MKTGPRPRPGHGACPTSQRIRCTKKCGGGGGGYLVFMTVIWEVLAMCMCVWPVLNGREMSHLLLRQLFLYIYFLCDIFLYHCTCLLYMCLWTCESLQNYTITTHNHHRPAQTLLPCLIHHACNLQNMLFAFALHSFARHVLYVHSSFVLLPPTVSL